MSIPEGREVLTVECPSYMSITEGGGMPNIECRSYMLITKGHGVPTVEYHSFMPTLYLSLTIKQSKQYNIVLECLCGNPYKVDIIYDSLCKI